MKKTNFYAVILTSTALIGAALGCSGPDEELSARDALRAGSNDPKKGGQSGGGGASGTNGGGGASGGANCTYTQGFWKNHAEAWPVTELTVGNTKYSKEQLLEIFRTPVKGNGLVSLAHQLIAAKLNIAAGGVPAAISATIADADATIGSLVVPPFGNGWLAPAQTSAMNDRLTHFNEGQTGPGHCKDKPRGSGGSGGTGGTDGIGGNGGSGGNPTCPPGVERCGASGTCSRGDCVDGCCVVVG